MTDNGRGIPIDPHPKVPPEVGARSHPDGAACGRQIRLGRLPDLGRPARRGRLGGQRAVRAARGRSGPRPDGLPPECSSAAIRAGAAGGRSGATANRRGTKVRFRPGCRRSSAPRAPFSIRRGLLPHGAIQGLPLWRRRGALALRARADRPTGSRPYRPRLRSSFPGGLKDYLSQDEVEGHSGLVIGSSSFTGKVTKPGGHGSVEWAVSLARRGRRHGHAFVLQHHPDPERRHPRGGAAGRRCCVAVKEHAERIGQAKRAAANVTADDVLQGCVGHAFGVYPRAGVPGAEQGAGCMTLEAARIVDAAVRDSLRPLARRPRPRRRSELLDWSGRAGRGAAASTRREGPCPQDRRPES